MSDRTNGSSRQNLRQVFSAEKRPAGFERCGPCCFALEMSLPNFLDTMLPLPVIISTYLWFWTI